MSHLDLAFTLFMPVNGLRFLKTQHWPISVSLSGIKKNSLKLYTNPLLCQQDSRVTYLNDYFVMCLCLRRTSLMGERIV